MTDRLPDDVDGLVERAEAGVGRLMEGADEVDEALELLDDLEDVADEAEDVLAAADLADLAAAIDWDDVPEAVEVSDVPEAVREGEVTEAVALRKLLSLSDLPAVWDGVDVRELWREKRELDDEVADLTGEEDDEGSVVSGGVDVDGTADDRGLGEFDPETVENAVQSEISDAVGRFREKLLEAHDRLREVREANEERFADRGQTSDSRNPTAGFSSVPDNHAGMGGTGAFSTVPEETRYSTAPNRKRIYGGRFDASGGEDGG